jgi:hypothetical protein
MQRFALDVKVAVFHIDGVMALWGLCDLKLDFHPSVQLSAHCLSMADVHVQGNGHLSPEFILSNHDTVTE